jgi:hypothetical protein
MTNKITNYDIIINLSKDSMVQPEISNISILNMKSSRCESDEVREIFLKSSISASDLRAKTLVIFDDEDLKSNLVSYATLLGFAGRRLDILYRGTLVEAGKLHHFSVINKNNGRPDVVSEYLGNFHTDLCEKIDLTGNLESSTIEKIRFAKYFFFNFIDCSVRELEEYITIAGIRVRNNGDHLPIVLFDSNDLENDDKIDLDEFRKMGNELRREIKVDNRDAVISFVAPDSRLIELAKVSELPVDIALGYLGSYMEAETEFWRCPRPERHRNGDMNPSLKINEGKIRCYRCDYEPLDSLRLIMDSENCSVDEASEIIKSLL